MSSVLISGANRGLGLEFAKQYLKDGWHVIALCRDKGKAMELAALGQSSDQLEIYETDVTNFNGIRELAENLADLAIDVVINNAGIFGPKPGADGDHRQSLGSVDSDIFNDVLTVNAVAPLILTEAFLDQVLASEQKKVITISSVMGSIEETQGGLLAYRMSKAAINMAMACLAKELAPKGVIVNALNPGWVKTDMGGVDASVTPADSITAMRKIIAGLSIEQTGTFIDYDGRIIPW